MNLDLTSQISTLEDILNRNYSPEMMELYRQDLTKRFGHESREMFEAKLNNYPKRVIFINKNEPSLMGEINKNGQLIFRLDSDWVAKWIGHREFGGRYEISNFSVFSRAIQYTFNVIKEEFGLEFPWKVLNFKYENNHVKLKISDEGPIMIVPDSTENGRYLVRDIDPNEDFSRFNNSDEVEKEYKKFMDRLMGIYTESEKNKLYKWRFDIDKHTEKEGPIGAIRRMFFLIIDPSTNNARIYPGDFNHVCIYPREWSILTKDKPYREFIRNK